MAASRNIQKQGILKVSIIEAMISPYNFFIGKDDYTPPPIQQKRRANITEVNDLC